jgi:thymidine phosphorylase
MITAMDAPLGRAVGNANEVVESIETLKGRGPADLEELSVLLAARMLIAAGVAATDADAQARIRSVLSSGAGVEKFRQIIERQGGDPRVIDDYGRLSSAPDREYVTASASGFVSSIEAERVGRAAVALGAGRGKMDDVVDHGVGITVLAPVGQQVRAGDRVLEIQHRAGHGLEAALTYLRDAIRIGETTPSPRSLVVDTIQT